MLSESDKIRIHLSTVFIATYVAIILAYKDRLTNLNDLSTESLAIQLLFSIVVLNGVLIVISFFAYLLFTALELDFHKEKEIAFGQDIGSEKLTKLKKYFYNLGVSSIFYSIFSYPFYFLCPIILSAFGVLWSILIFFLFTSLIAVLFNILFSDRKILVSKVSGNE